MNKKILLTVGGTGGHVYPALTLANQLKASLQDPSITFAGGHLGSNPYFDKSAFQFYDTPCGTLSSRNPLKFLKNGYHTIHGVLQSRCILRELKPDIVIGFGSYHTFPVLVASKLMGIPFVLHESNSIPGKVNKLMAPYALFTGVQFPSAASFLKGKVIEVGMPLREGFHKGTRTRQEACEYFGLSPKGKTVLIFGGSQGARALNSLVVEAFKKGRMSPISFPSLQAIHITGTAEEAQRCEAAYQNCGIPACVKPFEGRMDMAWQAADLVIARAGAGTLAEEFEFEVPGILIPYPYAADGHQDRNGEFLVSQVGGGEKYAEKELTPLILKDIIASFFVEEGLKLKKMQEAIRYYKNKVRTADFCSLINHFLNR